MTTSNDLSGSNSSLLVLEKELICFICTEVLYQPLTLIDCLHTFCGSCLKEWFSHQQRKASQSRNSSSSNPYTCPACRATVKDARHDARIATWLEMFLTAHPSRGRSTEEQEEMKALYKPGEDILPALTRNKRREHRHRREEDSTSSLERRMTDEARQRSLRDSEGTLPRPREHLSAPRHSQRQDRSRSRDHQRDQERAERRRRVEEAEAQVVERAETTPPAVQQVPLAPPATSPRHPSAVEARQRERGIAHQASLRSLVSSSEEGSFGTGDSMNEARIMQEILAEGLLDGIDVDQLTEAEQDALSERIAEAYRRRHPRRGQRTPPDSTEPTVVVHPSTDVPASTEPTSPPRLRSRSRHRSMPDGSHQENDTSLQPTSATLSPPPTNRTHRRRASDESRRRQSSPAHIPRSPVSRSVTDLSIPEPSPALEHLQRTTGAHRSQTEPIQHTPSITEAWDSCGAEARETRHHVTARPVAVDDAPTLTTFQGLAAPSIPLTTFEDMAHPKDDSSLPEVAAVRSQEVPTSQHNEIGQAPLQIPKLTCFRCSRSGIELDVHKHCDSCDVNLCLPCYRNGRGCNHWFGFGNAALRNFNASGTDRSSKLLELPHVLVGRQYHKSRSSPLPDAGHDTSTEGQLQEGNFCDRCGTFANNCFWNCDYCNDGEWGFCNECVDTHHCCTHPLLPIAFRPPVPFSPFSPLDQPPTDYEVTSTNHTPDVSRPSTSHSDHSPFFLGTNYAPLTINASCDMCGSAISPSKSRYHCPSHISSTSTHNLGGYDICSACYMNQVRSGRVKKDDGPSGWRKCPAGHRMITLKFDIDDQGHQRRVILEDLVGGWRCTEDDMNAWNEAHHRSTSRQHQQETTSNTQAEQSHFRRSMAIVLGSMDYDKPDTPQKQPRFPPSGGFGAQASALWSYIPGAGDDSNYELMFPRNAELREIDDSNDDWWSGVYAGEVGWIYTPYVRKIE